MNSSGLRGPHHANAWLPLLLIAVCWWAGFQACGLWSAGFHLIDEHVIVEMVAELDHPTARLLHVMGDWVAKDFGERRFRPLYYASRVLRAEWFGLHWAAWAAYNALLAVVTTTALFHFGRLVGFTVVMSAALGALATLGPPSTVWWRLGTPETEGNALIALVMLLLAWSQVRHSPRSRAEWSAFGLAFLASLTKEGVILYLPALAVLRVWLGVRLRGESVGEALKGARAFVCGLAVLAVSELTVVAFTVGTDGTGYAGVDARSFDLFRLWFNLKAVDVIVPFWIPVLATCWSLASRGSRWREPLPERTRGLLLAWLVFWVAAVPQVLLYAKSGWAPHYYNPLAISGALLTVTAVDSLRPLHRGVYLVLLACALIQVHTRFQWTKRHAREYAEEGRALHSLLDATVLCTSADAPLLLVANPRAHFEEAFSLRTYLQLTSGRPRIYLAAVGSEAAEIFSEALVQQEQARAFIDPGTLAEHYFKGQTLARLHERGAEQPGAIIVFAPERLLAAFVDATSGRIALGDYSTREFDISGVRMGLYCRGR